MPHHDIEALVTALANMGIICEKSTSTRRAKLGSVKVGSDESYYMLAAFCFDLSRKMNYLFRAVREFAPEADPALAQQLIADNAAINAQGLSWEQRARAAEEIMLRTVEELTDEHEQVLRKVAGQSRE